MCFGDFYETLPSSISVIAWSDLADTKPSLYQIPWQGLLQNASRKPCDVKLVQFQTRSQGLTKDNDHQFLIPGTQHQYCITIKHGKNNKQAKNNNNNNPLPNPSRALAITPPALSSIIPLGKYSSPPHQREKKANIDDPVSVQSFSQFALMLQLLLPEKRNTIQNMFSTIKQGETGFIKRNCEKLP